MKFDLKSLKVKVWLYFVAFTAIILTVLWFLQVIFINSFYQSMKIKEVVNIGNTIIEDYQNSNLDETLNELTYRNSLEVIVYDEDGRVVESSDMFEGFRKRDGEPSITNRESIQEEFQDVKQQLDDAEDNTSYTVEEHKGMERLNYVSAFSGRDGETLYLAITCTLRPMDSTVEVLKNQFIIITGILIVLSFFIAYLFSRHLSKPVVNLTDTAKQLADGNLNVVFEEGNYTEIGELAVTLNYATNEISKVDGLRKELMANVSHDLKTPLTIIKFYGEMIRDVSGNNPKKREEHAELIISEADRLTSLVNEILELSKAQTEELPINCSKFNLSSKTRGITERFQVLSEREGYTFSCDIEDNLWTFADEEKIERVIYNLIGNAVNYTGDDKLIQIRLHKKDSKLRLEITDTGCGISAEELPYIWERYYKTKGSHKRAVVGSGLGLSIVKQILKEHNAAFGAESIVNKGSVFWFELKQA